MLPVFVTKPHKTSLQIVCLCRFLSRTPTHFLQESVRFHFQDLGRQYIFLAGILEDLARNCLVLQDLARNVRILELTWKEMPDLGSNLEESA